MQDVFKYLFIANSKYRKSKFDVLKGISSEILRIRSSNQGWCIEELIRHMIQVEDWWIHRIVLQDKQSLHPAGIENDTQAKNWLSLTYLWKSWDEVESAVFRYLEEEIDLESRIPHENKEWNDQFTGRWVFYHLLQHELETWGMIAEKLRNLDQPYWEF